MARKRRKQARKRRQPRAEFPARYAPGTAVRVKRGTTDPDCPDIPLGGWAGTVAEVDRRVNPPTYLVEWNEYTLEHMHPVFRRRCERDDMDWHIMWLQESELEPDAGEPVELEQPTAIITRPLNPRNQDDRLRAILGATSDDPVPPVSVDSLYRYHDYLAGQLSFPLPATMLVETEPLQVQGFPVTVQGLLEVEEDDESSGLWCEADDEEGRRINIPLTDLELSRGSHLWRLLDDYDHWFGNYPVDDMAGGDFVAARGAAADGPSLLEGPTTLAGRAVQLGLIGAFYGAALGLLMATSGWARMGAAVGAVLGALVLGMMGRDLGLSSALPGQQKVAAWIAGIFGVLIGVAVGALAGGLVGTMIVAWPGTLLGIPVGVVAGPVLARVVNRSLSPVFGGALGAVVGAVVLTLVRQPHEAGVGLLAGIPAGGLGSVVLYGAITGGFYLVGRWFGGDEENGRE